MSRGYLVFARNSKHDYVRMAYALALSIKVTQRISSISLAVPKDHIVDERYASVFDHILTIPDGEGSSPFYDQWKFYDTTPYDETVILDADMIFPSSVDHWWDIYSKHDFCSANKVMNYRGEQVTSDYYRKVFTANELPNTYIAMTYFKKSDMAEQIFKQMKAIYDFWDEFSLDFFKDMCPKLIDGDVAMALAIKQLGYENEVVSKVGRYPTFVHMKAKCQSVNTNLSISDNWMDSIPSRFTKNGDLYLGHFKQNIPFHYCLKEWLTDKTVKNLEQLYVRRK